MEKTPFYIQPDWDLIFKYFPKDQWPTRDNYTRFFKKLEDPSIDIYNYKLDMEPYVGGTIEEWRAFWNGFKDPYHSGLIEQKHDLNEQKKIWNLEGNFENMEGDPNGIFVWNPKANEDINAKVWDLEEQYLDPTKNFSCELYAIHWWLKHIVKTKVNNLRMLPFQPNELKEYRENYGDQKKTVKIKKIERFRNELEVLKKELEIQMNFKISKTIEEKENMSRKLETVNYFLKILEDNLNKENQIRQQVCKYVNDFLVCEEVCNSPSGRNMVGAFLIFSSGLSFRNKPDNSIKTYMDIDIQGNFKSSLSGSNSAGYKISK
jgi:hypothetical protein